MTPAHFHEDRLALSRLYQRRELAARRARDLARARAMRYLDAAGSGRVWIVESSSDDQTDDWH